MTNSRILPNLKATTRKIEHLDPLIRLLCNFNLPMLSYFSYNVKYYSKHFRNMSVEKYVERETSRRNKQPPHGKVYGTQAIQLQPTLTRPWMFHLLLGWVGRFVGRKHPDSNHLNLDQQSFCIYLDWVVQNELVKQQIFCI